MNNKEVLQLVRQTADYTQKTAEAMQMAGEIVTTNQQAREKVASLCPHLMEKMASLQRIGGSYFLPEGAEKHAEAVLTSHPLTLTLVSQILDEYGRVKTAYDQLTTNKQTLGAPGERTTGNSKNASYDGIVTSQAFDNFNQRILNY